MSPFFILMLIGFGSGLVIFPIFLGLFLLIRNTKERRKIKRMLKKGNFLIPIDTQDYDVKAWENKRFGSINPKEHEEDLKNLNIKIFKKMKIDEENPFETKDEVSKEFLAKVSNYLKIAREKGYTDEYIIQEFKKKHYTDELIERILNENGRQRTA